MVYGRASPHGNRPLASSARRGGLMLTGSLLVAGHDLAVERVARHNRSVGTARALDLDDDVAVRAIVVGLLRVIEDFRHDSFEKDFRPLLNGDTLAVMTLLILTPHDCSPFQLGVRFKRHATFVRESLSRSVFFWASPIFYFFFEKR